LSCYVKINQSHNENYHIFPFEEVRGKNKNKKTKVMGPKAGLLERWTGKKKEG
jgi:hypothetical protein